MGGDSCVFGGGEGRGNQFLRSRSRNNVHSSQHSRRGYSHSSCDAINVSPINLDADEVWCDAFTRDQDCHQHSTTTVWRRFENDGVHLKWACSPPFLHSVLFLFFFPFPFSFCRSTSGLHLDRLLLWKQRETVSCNMYRDYTCHGERGRQKELVVARKWGGE